LQPYDGSATTVAADEGIDLQAKLRISEAWITDEAGEYLRWESGASLAGGESGITVRNAVVDERLKRWHLMNVLASLYRDASYSQANDRYQQRYQAYAKDAAARRMEYFQHGIPFVGNPMRRPPAPVVTVIAGTQAAAAYEIAITRVDGQGRESAGSVATGVEAGAGTSITVAAQGLEGSNGFNVYALYSDSRMRLQNNGVLSGSAVWTLPAAGLAEGAVLGTGQRPEGIVRQRRVLPRG
jgi:hypothetical protein